MYSRVAERNLEFIDLDSAERIAANTAELDLDLEQPLSEGERDSIAIVASSLRIISGRELTRSQALALLADELTRRACYAAGERCAAYSSSREAQ